MMDSVSVALPLYVLDVLDPLQSPPKIFDETLLHLCSKTTKLQNDGSRISSPPPL